MRNGKLSFFDPSNARGGRDTPDVGGRKASDDAAPLSVTALVSRIKGTLLAAFPRRVAVVGELSNFKRHGSGHWYFRVKDAGAAIDAVMFKRDASRVKFDPADGMEVVIEARVDIYDVRGQLQLYVEQMTPRGAGVLELAFRQLCEKLKAEGLFDPARKKPLPRYPGAIGVVTSPTGAAVRDIRRTLANRWPAARVYLVPVRVQGDEAAGEVADAIRRLDVSAGRFGIETIIVARGGGSLEDLWAFNEEIVARAIFAARTPIVSGVGHEVDTTVADLVADLRAPTPTGAAELAVPQRADVQRHVDQLAGRLWRNMRDTVQTARAALTAVQRSGVFRDPLSRVRVLAQRTDELSHRLTAGNRHRLATARQAVSPLEARLAALHPARLAERAAAGVQRLAERLRWALGGRSKRAGDALADTAGRLTAADPRHAIALAKKSVDAAERQLQAMHYRRVLNRGFSITRGPDGTILRHVADAVGGEPIETELADGTIASVVTGDAKKPAAPKPAPKKKKPDRDDHEPTLF